MDLTLFTTPKSFTGEFAVIQRNALASWVHLSPRPQVIVFGDAEGVAEVCADLDLQHVPDIACNELGTPLVKDLFLQAQRVGSGSLLCYANADIVFLDDFLVALTSVAKARDRFLMIGQRCSVEVGEDIAFDGANWQADLRRAAKDSGRLDDEHYIDYFAFSRGLFLDVPPFAIGRAAYDNWLIWKARKDGVAVVDATGAVLAIHQAHGYGHIAGARAEVYQGAEARRNLELAGGVSRLFTIVDANHRLQKDGEVVRATGSRYRAARRRRRQTRLRENFLVRGTQRFRHRIGLRRSTWQAFLRVVRRLRSNGQE